MNRLPALPTNHIQRQKLELEATEAQRKSLEDSIHGLRALCRSDKFRENSYINVADVLLWAEQALQAQGAAESNTYAIGRMRQVVYANLTTALESSDASSLYQVQGDQLEGSEERTVYVRKNDLEMALEVLRADGFWRATVSEWETPPYGSLADEGRWVWDRSVTL